MNQMNQSQLNTVKVSICIPAYENAAGVRRLLESIADQSLTDYEIIVTDDSASGDVETLVQEYAASLQETAGDHRIQYYRNTPRKGAAGNWNEAIAHASGEYVKIMHHDDWFSGSDSLRRFVDIMDAHPDADLAFCGTYQVSPDGSRKARHIAREDMNRIRNDYRNLYLGNTIGAPSAVIVRRSMVEREGIAYDPALSWLVDEDYYLQILQRNPVLAYTEDPLISIGLSEMQLTNKLNHDAALLRREYSYIYRKFGLQDIAVYQQRLSDVLAANGASIASVTRAGGEYADCHISREMFLASRKAYGNRRRKAVIGTIDHLYGRVVNGIAGLHVGPIRAEHVTTALFWLAFTIEIALVIIDKSNYHNSYTGQIFRLTFLMFGTSLLTTRYTRREVPYLALFLVLGVLSWRISGRNEILRYTVFAAACVHRNGRRILQYMLWLTTAGCAALMALSVTGIYGAVSRTEDFGTGVTTRYCLGLGHPNALHCMAMMVVLMAVYLYDRRMRLWIYALLLVADVCLYGLTESATGTAVWALSILIGAALHYNRRLRRCDAFYLFSELCMLAGLALTVWGAIVYPRNSRILSMADAALTGRLASLWDTTFHEGTLSTWTWMGSRLNEAFFDLGWIRVIYWYGFVPAVMVLCGAAMMLRLYRRRRDAAAWTFLMSCILYTLVEAHLVSEFLGRNPLLVMAAMCVPALLHEDDHAAA